MGSIGSGVGEGTSAVFSQHQRVIPLTRVSTCSSQLVSPAGPVPLTSHGLCRTQHPGGVDGCGRRAVGVGIGMGSPPCESLSDSAISHFTPNGGLFGG